MVVLIVDIAIEQALEGQFRYAHSRVIAHSEEISFYRGADREQSVANAAFKKVPLLLIDCRLRTT